MVSTSTNSSTMIKAFRWIHLTINKFIFGNNTVSYKHDEFAWLRTRKGINHCFKSIAVPSNHNTTIDCFPCHNLHQVIDPSRNGSSLEWGVLLWLHMEFHFYCHVTPLFCIIYSMGLIRIFHLIWFLFVAVVGEKKVLIALVSQS